VFGVSEHRLFTLVPAELHLSVSSGGMPVTFLEFYLCLAEMTSRMPCNKLTSDSATPIDFVGVVPGSVSAMFQNRTFYYGFTKSRHGYTIACSQASVADILMAFGFGTWRVVRYKRYGTGC
jgi:hypothetical protein